MKKNINPSQQITDHIDILLIWLVRSQQLSLTKLNLDA